MIPQILTNFFITEAVSLTLSSTTLTDKDGCEDWLECYYILSKAVEDDLRTIPDSINVAEEYENLSLDLLLTQINTQISILQTICEQYTELTKTLT